jgi:hypothetical protein
MALDSFSQQEHQKIIDAELKYGDYYVSAHCATILLSNIMLWPVTDCDVFIRFLSQMKKHHTLSLISTIRLHRIQAKMNLRYFLESTANAAYSLAHIDTKNYYDIENSNIKDAQKANRHAYNWLDKSYNAHSVAIKRIKDQINEQTAHANVLNSQHNFGYIAGERPEIHTSFFDFEDEQWVKADLWQCAQAGLLAIDLLLDVQKKYGGFLPSRDVESLGELIADHDALWLKLSS